MKTKMTIVVNIILKLPKCTGDNPIRPFFIKINELPND